jgi:protease I
VTSGIPYSQVPEPAANPAELAGLKIGVLAAHGVQESEILFPVDYLLERGATVEVLAPSWSADKIIAVQYLRPTQWIDVDSTFAQAQAKRYDALVLTGGAWNAQVVGTDQDALKLVKDHAANKGLIAAICAGPQVLINAALSSGRTLTGTESLKWNAINSGARWSESSVVIDGNIVSAKGPDSLPEFMATLRARLLESTTAK